MQQNTKISIVVPIYQVEEYLEKCVKSIVMQTYRNFKLILVDDGSPDHCPEICDFWQEKDERIKVIHKINGGVSAARNVALDIAIGKYIVFVDPDDYIEVTMLERMFYAIDTKRYDLVCCNYVVQDIYGRQLKSKMISEETIFNQEEMLLQLLKTDAVGGFSCNKIFRNEIIKKHNLKFKENLQAQEDTLFCVQYIKNSSFCKVIPYCGYYYLKRVNSVVSVDSFAKTLSSCYAVLEIEEEIHENYISQQLHDVTLKKVAEALSAIKTSRNEQKSGIQTEIVVYRVMFKKYFTDIFLNDTINIMVKLKLLFICVLGVNLYTAIKRETKILLRCCGYKR